MNYTKNSTYSSCRASKRSPRRQEGTAKTSSIAWVVASLLAASQQPGTGVCAFTQSAKPNHALRRQSCLNYRNTERSQPNLDQQFIVDEYLESIDRRYKRVHQAETKDDRSQRRGFTSAWAWLTADESSLKEEKRRKNDDALSVLGLAELASVRLLQKHHLPITQLQDKNSLIIDVRGGDKDSKTNLSTRGIVAAKTLGRFLNRMQKACAYRCVVVSLQLRAGYYQTLRKSTSTLIQFLVASSIMSRCITRFASQTAVMATYVAVIMTRLFEGVN